MLITCDSRSRPRLDLRPSYWRSLSLMRTATFFAMACSSENQVAVAFLDHFGIARLGDEILVLEPLDLHALEPVGVVAHLADGDPGHLQQLGEARILRQVHALAGEEDGDLLSCHLCRLRQPDHVRHLGAGRHADPEFLRHADLLSSRAALVRSAAGLKRMLVRKLHSCEQWQAPAAISRRMRSACAVRSIFATS